VAYPCDHESERSLVRARWDVSEGGQHAGVAVESAQVVEVRLRER
jgi:hypothetical protein